MPLISLLLLLFMFVRSSLLQLPYYNSSTYHTQLLCGLHVLVHSAFNLYSFLNHLFLRCTTHFNPYFGLKSTGFVNSYLFSKSNIFIYLYRQ